MRSLLGRFHRPMSRGLVNNMLTMNNLGDGSTLFLDFTTMGGVLDPRLTFTRSTTATYINSSGYVTSAAINAPRFDYSPTNIGEPRGLLVEGQTQNVLYYSQDVMQGTRWSIQGGIPSSYASISATGGTAPDNTNTANLCTESTINVSRSIYQGLTAAAGTYTASVWVKAGTGSTRYIRLVIPSAAGNFVYMTVNISTGVVTQGPAIASGAVGVSAVSGTVTPYAGSWYRIQLTGTFAAAINFVFIVPLDSATPSVNTGDYGREAYLGNGSTFLIWGAQLELGSGASSYIPTGASQVTRTVDTCYMSGISSWYNESAGTVISNITYDELATNNSGIELSVGTGTSATNRIGIRKTYVDYYSGGGSAQAEMYPTVTSGNVRIGTAYSLNDFAMCSNGGTMRTDGSGAVPVGLNTLKLYADNGTSGLVINGLIKSIKYFPTRLSNAQLQTLTTP